MLSRTSNGNWRPPGVNYQRCLPEAESVLNTLRMSGCRANHEVGRGKTRRDPLCAPTMSFGQCAAVHRVPPGYRTPLVKRDHGAGEDGLGRKCRLIDLEQVDVQIEAQLNQLQCRLSDVGPIGAAGIKAEAGLDQGNSRGQGQVRPLLLGKTGLSGHE
jgi:hypothetical protein